MIRTEELYIDNTDEKATAAIAVADEFIKSLVLDKKQAMHLRLLAEETIGMVRAMTVNFEAYFWLEKENDEYRVKLNVRTDMSKEKKEELLSLSTSGENVAVKGFMGKIREMIENSLLDFDSALSLQQKFGGNSGYSYVGMGTLEDDTPLLWSLNSYKESLQDEGDVDTEEDGKWDELERSIVASLAKEVTIGIRNNIVDMTIIAR